jgi:hypothetical protein
MSMPEAIKKAHPIDQMSFQIFCADIFEALNLTYRSASRRMELAPFLFVIRDVTGIIKG